MIESTLFRMFMDEGRFAMDASEKETNHLKDYKESEQKLLSMLSDEQKEAFADFRYEFLYHILAVRDIECNNVMFDCVKIGMEFQKFLDDKEY